MNVEDLPKFYKEHPNLNLYQAIWALYDLQANNSLNEYNATINSVHVVNTEYIAIKWFFLPLSYIKANYFPATNAVFVKIPDEILPSFNAISATYNGQIVRVAPDSAYNIQIYERTSSYQSTIESWANIPGNEYWLESPFYTQEKFPVLVIPNTLISIGEETLTLNGEIGYGLWIPEAYLFIHPYEIYFGNLFGAPFLKDLIYTTGIAASFQETVDKLWHDYTEFITTIVKALFKAPTPSNFKDVITAIKDKYYHVVGNIVLRDRVSEGFPYFSLLDRSGEWSHPSMYKTVEVETPEIYTQHMVMESIISKFKPSYVTVYITEHVYETDDEGGIKNEAISIADSFNTLRVGDETQATLTLDVIETVTLFKPKILDGITFSEQMMMTTFIDYTIITPIKNVKLGGLV